MPLTLRTLLRWPPLPPRLLRSKSRCAQVSIPHVLPPLRSGPRADFFSQEELDLFVQVFH